MSDRPKQDVRPVIPRELVDQVVEKAKLEGEEMAGLDPSFIIRVILKRYVEAGKTMAPPARVRKEKLSKKPSPPSGADRKLAPKVASEGTRSQLHNKLLQVLHDSLLDDELTKPMDGKVLGSKIKTSQHFAEQLIQELIGRKLVEVAEERIGRRDPRYRLLDPLKQDTPG
jgi:hypothetical protein